MTEAQTERERVNVTYDPLSTGEGSRYISARAGLFWRSGRATRVCRRTGTGNENRLHTQVGPDCWTDYWTDGQTHGQNTFSPSLCRYSGVLSAYGLALADVVEDVQEPCSLQYNTHSYSELDRRIQQLSQRCHDTLHKRGFNR